MKIYLLACMSFVHTDIRSEEFATVKKKNLLENQRFEIEKRGVEMRKAPQHSEKILIPEQFITWRPVLNPILISV